MTRNRRNRGPYSSPLPPPLFLLACGSPGFVVRLESGDESEFRHVAIASKFDRVQLGVGTWRREEVVTGLARRSETTDGGHVGSCGLAERGRYLKLEGRALTDVGRNPAHCLSENGAPTPILKARCVVKVFLTPDFRPVCVERLVFRSPHLCRSVLAAPVPRSEGSYRACPPSAASVAPLTVTTIPESCTALRGIRSARAHSCANRSLWAWLNETSG